MTERPGSERRHMADDSHAPSLRDRSRSKQVSISVTHAGPGKSRHATIELSATDSAASSLSLPSASSGGSGPPTARGGAKKGGRGGLSADELRGAPTAAGRHRGQQPNAGPGAQPSNRLKPHARTGIPHSQSRRVNFAEMQEGPPSRADSSERRRGGRTAGVHETHSGADGDKHTLRPAPSRRGLEQRDYGGSVRGIDGTASGGFVEEEDGASGVGGRKVLNLWKVRLYHERGKRKIFLLDFLSYLPYFCFLIYLVYYVGPEPTGFLKQQEAIADLFLDEEFTNATFGGERQFFKKNFADVMTVEEVWQWVEGPLSRAVYGEKNEFAAANRSTLGNVWTVGGIQLRSNRVHKRNCSDIRRKQISEAEEKSYPFGYATDMRPTELLQRNRVSRGVHNFTTRKCFPEWDSSMGYSLSSENEAESERLARDEREEREMWVGRSSGNKFRWYRTLEQPDYLASELKGSTVMVASRVGRVQGFGSGGYGAVLPPPGNREAAHEIIEALKADEFLDASTRSFAVSVSLYNPNNEFYVMLQAGFFFSETGHISKYSRVEATKPMVHPFYCSSGIQRTFLYFWLLSVIYLLWTEIKELHDAPRLYFRDMWNWFELLFLLSAVYLLFRMWRFWTISELMTKQVHGGEMLWSDGAQFSVDCPATQQCNSSPSCVNTHKLCVDLKKAPPQPGQSIDDTMNGCCCSHGQFCVGGSCCGKMQAGSSGFIDLMNLRKAARGMRQWLAIMAWVSVLKFFKYTRLSKRLNFLWRCIDLAFWEIAWFLVILFVIVMAFAMFATIAFGHHVRNFHNIPSSMLTLTRWMVGDFDSVSYDSMKAADAQFAPMFLGTYVFLVLLTSVNMFIAILTDFYDQAKTERMLHEETARKLGLDRVQYSFGHIWSSFSTRAFPKWHINDNRIFDDGTESETEESSSDDEVERAASLGALSELDEDEEHELRGSEVEVGFGESHGVQAGKSQDFGVWSEDLIVEEGAEIIVHFDRNYFLIKPGEWDDSTRQRKAVKKEMSWHARLGSVAMDHGLADTYALVSQGNGLGERPPPVELKLVAPGHQAMYLAQKHSRLLLNLIQPGEECLLKELNTMMGNRVSLTFVKAETRTNVINVSIDTGTSSYRVEDNFATFKVVSIRSLSARHSRKRRARMASESRAHSASATSGDGATARRPSVRPCATMAGGSPSKSSSSIAGHSPQLGPAAASSSAMDRISEASDASTRASDASTLDLSASQSSRQLIGGDDGEADEKASCTLSMDEMFCIPKGLSYRLWMRAFMLYSIPWIKRVPIRVLHFVRKYGLGWLFSLFGLCESAKEEIEENVEHFLRKQIKAISETTHKREGFYEARQRFADHDIELPDFHKYMAYYMDSHRLSAWRHPLSWLTSPIARAKSASQRNNMKQADETVMLAYLEKHYPEAIDFEPFHFEPEPAEQNQVLVEMQVKMEAMLESVKEAEVQSGISPRAGDDEQSGLQSHGAGGPTFSGSRSAASLERAVESEEARLSILSEATRPTVRKGSVGALPPSIGSPPPVRKASLGARGPFRKGSAGEGDVALGAHHGGMRARRRSINNGAFSLQQTPSGFSGAHGATQAAGRQGIHDLLDKAAPAGRKRNKSYGGPRARSGSGGQQGSI